ncbi:hypothetical protein AAFF_G00236730 [Aldrovandia affinis]|uniref:Uncharacterized protein n=1 Tax=Aldrovandia affinis TaxID=143900 RepID=A0AAD7REX9_9TELE|nr:hypothetical protein AAFF_G00236730 [Aldrovandia affinis]
MSRAAASTTIRSDYQATPRVLINNIQWVHVPVLINMTAWSPDLDKNCKGESVTGMYKDLLTTAFLRYHDTVDTYYHTDSPKPASTGRKLLGFLEGVLGSRWNRFGCVKLD